MSGTYHIQRITVTIVCPDDDAALDQLALANDTLKDMLIGELGEPESTFAAGVTTGTVDDKYGKLDIQIQGEHFHFDADLAEVEDGLVSPEQAQYLN